jgi:hypothetical protein
MNKLFRLPKESPFLNLLRQTDKLAEARNFEGLKDLIKLILRPIQSEHLRDAYLKPDHEARESLSWAHSLGFKSYLQFSLNDTFYSHRTFIEWCTSEECAVKNKNLYPRLKLSSDIVLPTPWHPLRILRNIGSIGEFRAQGAFKQDPSNHIVIYHYPLMIGWVGGGNHSIMQGIITGEGSLVPEEVHDISPLIDEVYFDGVNWRDNKDRKIGQPRYQEFGWCWEIARRIKALEDSPFKG